MTKNWKVVLGLTGGLGSGKSTVLKMFQKKGAMVLDADILVHEAFRKTAVLRKIKRAFGTTDKKELAGIVFVSPLQRRKLERILHPLVRKEMRAALLKKKGDVAVCDVPLLYERGWHKQFRKILVVDSPMALRLKRLKKRGLPVLEAKRRIKAQWPLSKKVSRADFVVKNDSTLQKTKSQVDSIWNILINKS